MRHLDVAPGRRAAHCDELRRLVRRVHRAADGADNLGGTAVAQRARAFGLSLACYDPYLSPGAEKGHGAVRRWLTFGELLRNVDVVTFHCPLTRETRHMLDAAALRDAGARSAVEDLVCPELLAALKAH